MTGNHTEFARQLNQEARLLIATTIRGANGRGSSRNLGRTTAGLLGHDGDAVGSEVSGSSAEAGGGAWSR